LIDLFRNGIVWIECGLLVNKGLSHWDWFAIIARFFPFGLDLHFNWSYFFLLFFCLTFLFILFYFYDEIFCCFNDFLIKIENNDSSKKLVIITIRSKTNKNNKSGIRTHDPALVTLWIPSLPNELNHVFERKCDENQYNEKWWDNWSKNGVWQMPLFKFLRPETWKENFDLIWRVEET
jgi:hypothetical protein